MGNIPINLKYSFEFIKNWLRIACMKATGTEDSMVRAKYQNCHAERNVLGWMLRHSLFVNYMPLPPGPQAINIMECFNKDIETVAALKPADKAKKYTYAELRCLRAQCSLIEAELMTSLPHFHKKLLS